MQYRAIQAWCLGFGGGSEPAPSPSRRSLTDVKAFMGHADIQTTMIYVHHVPHHAADRLTDLLDDRVRGTVDAQSESGGEADSEKPLDSGENKCRRWDSNPRHADYDGCPWVRGLPLGYADSALRSQSSRYRRRLIPLGYDPFRCHPGATPGDFVAQREGGSNPVVH